MGRRSIIAAFWFPALTSSPAMRERCASTASFSHAFPPAYIFPFRVAVDCGATGNDEAEEARAAGLGSVLPRNAAIMPTGLVLGCAAGAGDGDGLAVGSPRN